ncbi:MAG: hypothetical protein RPV21_12255 [Candidatus Sedimenticola sp. (ex Thyasira tokunagai)]
MKKSQRILATTLTLALAGAIISPSVPAQERSGAAATQKKPAEAQQMQHRRGPKQFTFSNADGAVIQLWKPDLSTLPLEAKMGVITIPSTSVDNYHAIVAEKDWGYLKEAIIRYEYLRGKPSGESPTRLSAAEKTTFEVVPAPIPRGHYHYHSDQEWSFAVRFKQTLLSGVPVVMETANGSRLEGITDANGSVRFHIPEDFPNIVEGERDKRSADFTVSAAYEENGTEYQTMLSSEYRVNPQHWKSLSLGVTVTAIGLLAGGFIGRVRKTGKATS